MKFRPTDEYDIHLAHRVCLWAQALQAVLGVFLLMNTMLRVFHMVLAAIVAVTWLLTHVGWHIRGCRVLARILAGIPLVAAVVFIADLVLSWGDVTSMLGWLETLCILGGLLLSYLSVGAAYISIKGRLYDHIVACFYATWLVVVAGVATFHKTVCYDLLWSWDNDIVRYGWLGVVTAAAILTWLCAFLRTPEQKAAALAEKQKKAVAKAEK